MALRVNASCSPSSSASTARVRDHSPAYYANIFPGDLIYSVNGLPADLATFQSQMVGASEVKIKLMRGGKVREITMKIPPDWRV